MTISNDAVTARVLGPAIREHWRLFLVEGLVLLVLGSAAILVPVLASVAIAIFLGWLFVAGGIAGLAATLMGRRAPGLRWSLLSALVALVAGVAMIGWPLGGTVSLTFMLTAFLVIDGLLMVVFALDHRRGLSDQWGWILVNG